MPTLSRTENGPRKCRPKSRKRKTGTESANPAKRSRLSAKMAESNREEPDCINPEAAGEDSSIFDNVLNADRPVSERSSDAIDSELAAEQNLTVEEEILRRSSVEEVGLDNRQLVCFRLADEEYGVDIQAVREINRSLNTMALSDAPAYIAGLVDLRGNVIPVVNLRLLLGFPDQEDDRHTRIIVLEEDAGKNLLGIKVDAVTVVLRIPRDQIDPIPAQTVSGEESFLESIYRRDDTLVLIIDNRRIFSMKVSGGESAASAGNRSGE